MKLSVLHVYRTYFPDPPGGLQEAIRQITIATGNLGVANTIFTLSPHPEPCVLQRPEAQVVRSRSWAAPVSCDLGGIGAVSTFASLSQKADLLHYHFPWPFADLLRKIVVQKVPAVITYHSDVVRQRYLQVVYAPLMWWMLKNMRAIVATSPAYAKTSPVLSHPSLREKVRVIPLGIDEKSYSSAGDERIFDRIGLPPKKPYFLFVGVLRYYKGVQFLLQAAADVNAMVVIVGSGPEEPGLWVLAENLGLKNVIFAGRVTDAEKVALLKSCLALVLPSHLRSEAFGMVLVEAAMFGHPMISCEVGTGTTFVNAHGETGLVVPPESPVALAEAMKSLLDNNSMRAQMGQAARRRYERLFSGEALGRAYTALYREVVG